MGYLLTQIARFFEGLPAYIGSHLNISVAGIFFFGTSMAFSLGAYVFAIMAKAGNSILISLLMALLSSVILGLIFSIFYRRLSTDSFVVFTLASFLAFNALIVSWDSLTGGVLGISNVPKPAIVSNLLSLVVLQGIVALSFIIFEYTVLKSPFGRALQAHKENKIFLDSTGWNSNFVGSSVIVLASLMSAISGILSIWRIQFLDPTFSDISMLIEILTISVLAAKPKVSWIIGSTAVIVFLPEVLRFFPFPSSVLGYLRIIFYSGLLIILVKKMSSGYTYPKRFV